jgi:glucan phosphoethanolaminetransferase (alkaline phosphatase superfamily)
MVNKSYKLLIGSMFGIRVILVGLAIAAAIILFKLRLRPFELFHQFALHIFLLIGFLIVVCLCIMLKIRTFSLFYFHNLQLLWPVRQPPNWNSAISLLEDRQGMRQQIAW